MSTFYNRCWFAWLIHASIPVYVLLCYSLTDSGFPVTLYSKFVTNCYSKLDMVERRKRQFDCKPCRRKHPAPVNANCEFQRARQAEGDQSEDEIPQPGPSNMGRTLRGTRRRTMGAVQTPKAKPSKRVLVEEDSPGSAHEQPGREDPLDRIMQRLDSLADEGRRARQTLADETRREHEKLREAMRSMQAR